MKPVFAETNAVINAPIERVWEVMLKVEDYPKWNPFVVRVVAEGDVKTTGTRMKLHVKWKNGGQQSSDEVIEEVASPVSDATGIKRAHWSYRFRGVLDYLGCVHALRFQWLEQNSDGTTTYRTREEFTGLFVRFIPLANVQDGFERQAKALAGYFQ